MTPFLIGRSGCLKGELYLSGDKSITHRAIIAASLACGATRINNPAVNKDCFFTISAFRKLGIRIISNESSNYIIVFGKGLYGLKQPKAAIYTGDSGTTMRLLAGLLVGQKFNCSLSAGKSLSRRPMKRIITPLRLMGSDINGKRIGTDIYPPLKIKGSILKGINYKLPVASAQVKSAIILAGLYAKGITRIIEPLESRDHTERMLKLFKAGLSLRGKSIIVSGTKKLVSPGSIDIPADISSASFFIVSALLLRGSHLTIKSVSLNPTRIGLINVLKRMGARIEFRRQKKQGRNYEPSGDLIVKYSQLKGVTVRKEEIPSLIDELPILMVAACFAKGRSKFIGIEELKVKETDRVHSLFVNLKKMGAGIGISSINKRQAVVIDQARGLTGASLNSFDDHRTAMSLIVAGLNAKGTSCIDDVSCIRKSFPDFIQKLKQLLKPA